MGIDPGLAFTGFSIASEEQGKTTLLDCGILRLNSDHTLQLRVATFHAFVTDKLRTSLVTDVAIETPFLGKNAQNFLKLGYLRGIVYLLTHQHALMLHEFSPRQVKLAVTGYGGADKDQVACAIKCIFPQLASADTALRHDTTDAIAIALCGLWHAHAR